VLGGYASHEGYGENELSTQVPKKPNDLTTYIVRLNTDEKSLNVHKQLGRTVYTVFYRRKPLLAYDPLQHYLPSLLRLLPLPRALGEEMGRHLEKFGAFVFLPGKELDWEWWGLNRIHRHI